jgi:hypothetical protein
VSEEDWNALRYEEPVKDEHPWCGDRPDLGIQKPRRMQGNRASIYHEKEHYEGTSCAWHGCQPVEAEQDHIGDSTEKAAPDPGEGWRWVKNGETAIDGDEMWIDNGKWVKVLGCLGEAVGETLHGPIRRRVEPEKQEQGFVDYPLEYEYELHCFRDAGGGVWHAYQAPSLRGFMGFVYAGSEENRSLHPCRWIGEIGKGAIEFPVAVRFKKESK